MPQEILNFGPPEANPRLPGWFAIAASQRLLGMFSISVLWLASGTACAQSANPSLTLRIICDPVPSGGWAQIGIYASPPVQIAAGTLSMDLDSSFFGGIANVAVFSATGDAAGYAHVSGNHVDAHFSSGSGSIGQLPGLPVFAISVPLLPGLAQSATAALTLNIANSSFNDPLGRSYSLSVMPATAQTGGSLSVQSVSPGGGVVPRGGVVQIDGTGFDSSTAVAITGVSIASTQLVSSQQIDITLGGAAEMTGKRLRLTNSAGGCLDFFTAMPSAPGGESAPTEPLAPLTTYQLVQWTYPIADPQISQYFALQNPTTAPVTATFFSATLCLLGAYTIPPGGLFLADYNQARLAGGSCSGSTLYGPLSNVYMTASAPIRMLAYQDALQFCNNCPAIESTFPPIALTSLPAPSSFFTVVPFVWDYQIGQSPPSALGLGFSSNTPVSVSLSQSASQWLTATLTPGTLTASPALNLTPKVESLAPGTYTGSFTVTISTPLPPFLSQYPAPSATYQVALNVSASPLIMLALPSSFGPMPPPTGYMYAGPYPATIVLQTTSDPAPFTASATTTGGGNWLVVTPSKGTTPASVTVNVNPAGVAPGSYSGQVTVQGPANTTSLPLSVTFYPPTALSFVLEPGASTPTNAPQTLFLEGSLPTISTFSIQTQSGGNWLAATTQGLTGGTMQVSASAAGLGPGTYQATITAIGTNSSLQVPVTLTVLAPPVVPLTAAPASLFLSAAPGQTATQSFTVNSPGGAAIFTMSANLYPGPLGGTGVNPPSSLTVAATSVAVASTPSQGSDAADPSPANVAPATYRVQASAAQPGTYYGNIVITWDSGSLTIPITLSVMATAGFPPVMANIVNAASQAPAPLAPGEIISIYGMGTGAAHAGFAFDGKGNRPTTIDGTQVLIDGQPAPLFYVSASQINAIVPYEVGASGTATVQVVSSGLPSATWEMPVAPAAVGLFTFGGGTGQAVALNQDNSVNSASNPAAEGTTIQIYGAGGGQTTTLPVSATIGGVDAPVAYHGSAPGEVAGLLQVNAVVPPTVTPGSALPILVSVGSAQSQRGVTIAVK
jgi:uncharacterized protein (TIGR03437 family)